MRRIFSSRKKEYSKLIGKLKKRTKTFSEFIVLLIITRLIHFLSTTRRAHRDLIFLLGNERGQVDDYKSAVRHSRDDSRMPT